MSDSRQYRFAYLIRTRQDFPKDFPPFTERTLFPALFLPRDGTDWFARAAHPPRVVLFTGQPLEAHFHPESGRQPVSLLCNENLSIQVGRFLLLGWIGFASTGVGLKLPYNRRIDEPVDLFLGILRHRLLGTEKPKPCSPGPVHLGDALDLKFQNNLIHEIDKDETVSVRLYVAPRIHTSGLWPFRIRRSTIGNLIAVTDRRLFWITERYRDTRAQYGSVTCYAHLDNLAQVETDSAGTVSSAVSRLSVSLRNGKIWSLDIPEELEADAREFAAMARACSASPRDWSEVRR
jgi:hypothetical protein